MQKVIQDGLRILARIIARKVVDDRLAEADGKRAQTLLMTPSLEGSRFGRVTPP